MENNKIVMGIVAHVDAGKTTLSENILFNTGVIRSKGRVDSGDTFLDTDAVERERGITIYSKDARFRLADREVILVDTPGHVDFAAETERVLPVLDMAVLLISAASGVQSHTKTLWSLLKTYRIPTFIFVNKMDMPGTDKKALLQEIKTKLSDCTVDFENVRTEEFYEEAATCQEELLNTFLEEGSIPDSDIRKAVEERKIFPVFFGSALKNEGIGKLLEGIEKFAPSGAYDSDGDVSAFAYKITRDAAGRRLTHLKLFSGKLVSRGTLGDEKINEIRIYNGEKYECVKEASAGDICAVVGLVNTHNGDAWGKDVRKYSPVLTPALSYAVAYPRDVDKEKMFRILKEIEEEDPTLSAQHNEQTGELFVSLMGDVQTEVLKRLIADRFGINVNFKDGKICYRETIDRTVEGVGHFEPLRHYAEVHLKMEPLERGSGLVFECDISEDILDRNWQRLIYTHLTERAHRGVLTGAPITDMKISLVSGRAHIKHTEGGDFRQATYRAIRQGLMMLKSIGACRLLEPYYDYTLVIPEEYVGRAMTDINQMSGTAVIAENDHDGGITVLTGSAPVSTMNGYLKEVTAYTKGLGQLSMTVSGYGVCHNEGEVLDNTLYDPDGDLRNPTSSVFCSHGAGTVVEWDEVQEYMHISYASKDGAFGTGTDGIITDVSAQNAMREAAAVNRSRMKREAENDFFLSVEEVDEIIRLSSHANDNGRQGSYKGISSAHRVSRKTEYNYDSRPSHSTKTKPCYMLVDGYNVIHAWPELADIAAENLNGASGRLNDILCNYCVVRDIPIIVVYDAYMVKGHATEEQKYHNITVVYTREAQTADQYIERYAHENAKNYDITVVTSDGVEQVIVMGAGSHVISSREFKEDVYSRFKEFNDRFGVGTEEG